MGRILGVGAALAIVLGCCAPGANAQLNLGGLFGTPPPPPPPAPAGPLHPSPVPQPRVVPLGTAMWYACADAAAGGPPALACQVKPAAPATPAALAQRYSDTLTAGFRRIAPENELKMLWSEPQQNTFDFTLVDKAAAYAKARNMRMRGHTLIYAAANPAWMNSGPVLFGWNRDSLLAAMRNHITTTMQHFRTAFPGVIDQWDVVNEPFLNNGTRDQNVYQRIVGADWIEQAFRAANAADPSALLFLNEFNADTPGPRQAAVYALAKDFVARKVPIDGVGLEMHIGVDGSYPRQADLQAVMAQYAGLGLRVEVTELDALRPWVADDGSAQRAAYNTVAEACRQAPNCTGVTVWGVTDPYSWRTADQKATLFDAAFAAKPSYGDVRCRLADPKPPSGAWTPVACGPPPPAPTQPAQPVGPSDGSTQQPPA